MRPSRLILLLTGGALLQLAIATVAIVAVIVVFPAQSRPADRCTEPVGSCFDELSAEQIEQLSSVDLPEGTEVLESRYQSALDWRMTATVCLPEGSPAPEFDPAFVWDGSTIGSDGVAREATTTIADDGRVVLEILAFSV